MIIMTMMRLLNGAKRFPENLKIEKVFPIYKKDEEFLLTNYRPISVLP